MNKKTFYLSIILILIILVLAGYIIFLKIQQPTPVWESPVVNEAEQVDTSINDQDEEEVEQANSIQEVADQTENTATMTDNQVQNEAPEEEVFVSKCPQGLCVEAIPLPGHSLTGSGGREVIGSFLVTNGREDELTISKLNFIHYDDLYTLTNLMASDYAIDSGGAQKGNAPAFVNRGNHYELSFNTNSGTFFGFPIQSNETLQIDLRGVPSPTAPGGSIEIFLSEIVTSEGVNYANDISSGRISVAPQITQSTCQDDFGYAMHPARGVEEPIRVRLTSPHGGNYEAGERMTITWETCDLPPNGQLFRAYLGPYHLVLEGPPAVNDGIEVVNLPDDIEPGSYALMIEVVDSYSTGGNYITFDSSDNVITVIE